MRVVLGIRMITITGTENADHYLEKFTPFSCLGEEYFSFIFSRLHQSIARWWATPSLLKFHLTNAEQHFELFWIRGYLGQFFSHLVSLDSG